MSEAKRIWSLAEGLKGEKLFVWVTGREEGKALRQRLYTARAREVKALRGMFSPAEMVQMGWVDGGPWGHLEVKVAKVGERWAVVVGEEEKHEMSRGREGEIKEVEGC